MIKLKWHYWRAGFFSANQSFLKTFQIALIGWIKARSMTTDRCKLTADKVIANSSPLYKFTFFPTDCQTNLPQTRIISVPEERA